MSAASDRPGPWRAVVARVDDAIDDGLHVSKFYRQRLRVVVQAWRATRDPIWVDEALATRDGIAQHEPYGLDAWVQMGDGLAEMGEPVAAAGCYRRALDIDADYYLDPDSRLPDRRRTALADFVRRHGELAPVRDQPIP
jgi:hypothetical protein